MIMKENSGNDYLEQKSTIKELYNINSFANGFVKGIVDLGQELIALDADIQRR